MNGLRKRIERDPDGHAYTDAAIAVPAGSAASMEGGRAVSTIPGYDPIKAKDPAWRLAFKKNRARQNEEALALLNRDARESAQAATGYRRSLAVVSASGTASSRGSTNRATGSFTVRDGTEPRRAGDDSPRGSCSFRGLSSLARLG